MPRGCGAQRLRAQTRLEGHGEPCGGDPASASRHGAAEEQRQEVRLPERPDPRLRRRRLGDGRRYDAGGGQRYRCGGDSGRVGGRYVGARSAGSALYRHRGDRHGRCVRAEKGVAQRRHPAQPRLGDRGRTLCRLRGRFGCQHPLPLRARTDSRTQLYGGDRRGQGVEGRPFGHPDRLPARQCQQTALPPAAPLDGRARPAALFGRRRRSAQRHSARGDGHGAGAQQGVRGVPEGGACFRKTHAGRVCLSVKK